MKKIYIIFACVILAITSCFYVVAADNKATMEIGVSAADGNGYFDVTVKLYNVSFSGMQAAFTFDPQIAQIVSISTGEAATSFDQAREILIQDNILSELWKNVDNTNGTFRFANYLTPGVESSLVKNNLIVASNKGLAIYKIRFKKISSADFALALSTTEESLPEGVVIADGKNEIQVTTRFDYPNKPSKEVTTGGGGGGGGGTPKPQPEPQPEPEVNPRDKRIENTVILQIDNYAVVIDGTLKHVDEDTEVRPYIKNNRTMVPLRLIAEAFENEVEWIPETRSVVIKSEGIEIVLNIGSDIVYVNGEQKSLDAAPEISNSRTFVPLRFIAEILGKDVNWDESNRAVIICPAEFPWDTENTIEKEYLADALPLMSPLVQIFYEGGNE